VETDEETVELALLEGTREPDDELGGDDGGGGGGAARSEASDGTALR
jgi:hypothetical protein